MQVHLLSDALGVEITDFDAGAPLDGADREALLRAYDEHHLLVFRDQDLTEDEQERFAGLFGPPIDELGDGQRSGFISNVLPDAAGDGPLPFHSDLTFTPAPVIGITLYAMELPPGGTSTWFANATAAAADLPDELQARVEGVEVTHALGSFILGRDDAKSREHELGPDATRATHPVLRKNPRTGVPVLFVTDLHAERIEGMPEAEGVELLDRLLAHLYTDDHVYEHRWQLHDLAIWDNQAIQHKREDVSTAVPRTFRRNSLNTARWVELVPIPGT
jgi:taurine dioxygenase